MTGMRRFGFLAALASAWALQASAQIVSSADTVRFGVIREVDGKKTVRAFVRNAGSAPAAILKVRPSCGCTAASFQKEEFAPGDSAWIDLTYDPYRRPGGFEKYVKVYPVDGEMIRIPIEGTVFASPETIDLMYPADGGLLRISEATLTPPAPLTERRSLHVNVYNDSPLPVWPRLESGSDAVEWESFPDSIPPGDKGLLGIYIYPDREPRRGPLEYTLRLFTSHSPSDDGEGSPVEIKVLTSKP